MPVVDLSRAEFFIHVYKEGALSTFGHDLKLRIERTFVAIGEDWKIEATFDLDSIVIVGAVEDGLVAPHALSLKDQHDIAENMHRAVLETRRYPKAAFRSTHVEPRTHGYHIDGKLELHGVERPLSFDMNTRNGRATARIPLTLPDFEMRPYKAFLGALKTKNDVIVEIDAALDDADPSQKG